MPKVKIPKRVAGVKVPGKVRKQAKKALKLTESRAVRDLALAGLTLAAEAMLDRGRAAPKAKKGGLDALDLGEIVHAAVAEGARRFLEGFEEGVAAAAPGPAKPPARAPAKAPPKPRRKRTAPSSPRKRGTVPI